MSNSCISATEIWDLAAGRLKLESDALYRQWFARMTAVSVSGDLLSLGVDNWFTANLIREEYGSMLENALSNINGRSFRYELVEGYELKPVPEAVQEAPVVSSAAAPADRKSVM